MGRTLVRRVRAAVGESGRLVCAACCGSPWSGRVEWRCAEGAVPEVSLRHSSCGEVLKLDGGFLPEHGVEEDCLRLREFFRETWQASGLWFLQHFPEGRSCI